MRIIKAGATSQTIYVEILDSTSTTGARKTGLAYNTSSLTAYYVRNGGSATSITLATLAAANSAYSSGGFKEVDSTNMPGIYRLDLPDAAVAAGATSVVVTLKGATGMVQVSVDIQLVTVDPQDSVRFGMTALPNAAAEAAGGLYTRGSGAGQINQPANGLVDVNVLRYGGTAGTFSGGRPEVNASHIAGSAVSTSSAQIGVNVVNAGGTAWGSGAITAGSIASSAITSAKFAAGAIDAATLATGTITAAKFAAGAIDAAAIADNAIDAGAIASGAITSAKFAAGAIDAAAIADNAIDLATFAADAKALFGVIAFGTAQSVTGTTIRLASAETFADDELIGATVLIRSATTGAGQSRVITDYVSATDTATVDTWTTTPTGTITYVVFGTAPASTSSPLAVNVTQFGGVAGTFASGIPEVKVASIAANAITATSIASDAITDAKVASDVTIASVTGAVGSVTGNVGGNVTGSVGSVVGAVGSVTGNVGGNVVGSVGSVTGAVGSVTGAVGSVTGLTASDVAAIKAKTDSLNFTVSGQVDANIQYVNDVAVTGTGAPGDEWGP